MVWLTARLNRRSDREMLATGLPASSASTSLPSASSPVTASSSAAVAPTGTLAERRDVAFCWFAGGRREVVRRALFCNTEPVIRLQCSHWRVRQGVAVGRNAVRWSLQMALF